MTSQNNETLNQNNNLASQNNDLDKITKYSETKSENNENVLKE